MRYALVKNKKVINIIEWDGFTPYEPAGGTIMVRLPESSMVDFNWDYDGMAFWPLVIEASKLSSDIPALNSAQLQALPNVIA